MQNGRVRKFVKLLHFSQLGKWQFFPLVCDGSRLIFHAQTNHGNFIRIFSGESKAEEMRRKREERKAQQQKRLEEKRAAKGGGALKLGAKKVAAD